MQLPHVYCLGNFQESQISILPEGKSGRMVDPDLEQKFIASWKELQEQADKNHKKVWESELYRLESVNKIDNSLEISFSTIPFSIRKMTTLFLPEVLRLGENYYSRGMFSSIFIKTSDNLYAFLKKSNKFVARNNFSFVGGAYSKTEKVVKDSRDLFETAKKEIFEELNISSDDIDNIALISIFLTSQTHACFLFSCSIKLSSQELINKYYTDHDLESSELILLPLTEIKEFLSKNLMGDINKIDLFNQAQNLQTASL